VNTLTVEDAAKHSGYAEPTIHRWAREGKIGAIKVRGAWAIDQDVLDAYVASITPLSQEPLPGELWVEATENAEILFYMTPQYLKYLCKTGAIRGEKRLSKHNRLVWFVEVNNVRQVRGIVVKQ
jgi:excisionase family DNA binding protein